jgi:protein-tyrosine phosphatase
MGRSRSVTMVIMYLMKKFDLSKDLAFSITKSRREVVDPNEGFIQKLEDLEEKMKQNSIHEMVQSTKVITQKFSDSSSSSEDLMERQRSVDI